MKTKKPVYMYQCIVCRKNFYTSDTTMRHCGRLTQWINGIEGTGINRASPMVRIEVRGCLEISEENLAVIMRMDNPHKGLVDSLHFGYVKTSGILFDVPEG